jgi:hypothetical protein
MILVGLIIVFSVAAVGLAAGVEHAVGEHLVSDMRTWSARAPLTRDYRRRVAPHSASTPCHGADSTSDTRRASGVATN